MDKQEISKLRYFLKDHIRLTTDFRKTDQNKGVSPPPVQKPYNEKKERIDLVAAKKWENIKSIDLITAIKNRKSHRVFKKKQLTLEEVSFLLWATQGIRQNINDGQALRNVPSAGARHSFETYLCVLNVEGLEPGIYRFLPVENQLLFEFQEKDLNKKIAEAAYSQGFIGKAPVTFIWTTIPYRMEWRYGAAAHKVIAIDAGHVCQNLYLAVEAINAGTCAIGAYNQNLMDSLLRVDGEDEFVIYLAPVGKI